MKIRAKRNLLSVVLIAGLISGPVIASAEEVKREIATSNSPTVAIEIDSGDLTINTWDRSLVLIEGTLDDRVENFEVDLRSQNSLDIEIEDADDSFRNGETDTALVITLPVNSRVSVEAFNGSVAINNVAGSVDVETVNGSVEVAGTRGFLAIETVNGSVNALDVGGDVEAETVNGSIHLVQVAGERLELSTVNGSMKVESVAPRVEVESVSGSTELNLDSVERLVASSVAGGMKGTLHLEKQGDLQVESVSGRVRLTLIEPLDLSVSIESLTGHIDNDINEVEIEKGDFGLGRFLNFSEGDASAEVRINTVSGEVDLRKKSN